jgi:hypothetical protein
MSVIPAVDLPLTTAVAKALVREKMKQMSLERGMDAQSAEYIAGTVDRLWEENDGNAQRQRSHYLALATVAIQEIRGYLRLPEVAPGALPQRTDAIVENTAVPHEQKPLVPPKPPAVPSVKPLPEQPYKGHPGMKGVAHPVDTFVSPAPKKDA